MGDKFYCPFCEDWCMQQTGVQDTLDWQVSRVGLATCEDRMDRHGSREAWVIVNMCYMQQLVCQPHQRRFRHDKVVLK